MKDYRKQDQFVTALQEALTPGSLLLDEPMKRHTTFQIGGPADYFVTPQTMTEVAAVVRLATQYQIPLTVFGNGSNVLVLDGGIEGIVVQFGERLASLSVSGEIVTAGAGALLADVSKFAAVQKLTGLEFAVGIPGSIGGAIFMNAGAYDGEMSAVTAAVSGVLPSGEIRRFERDELSFAYRHSLFQENGCIICEIELSLKNGERQKIYERMQELTMRREAKQPLEKPSAGSTFKRPTGYFAGTLIEETGLKGLRVGGAAVSEKHAGFVINDGGATAKDVLALIELIQQKVHDRHQVWLHPEVRVVGRR